MTRNLKVLGLALVAVFAMSAVMASAALAVTHTVKTEASTTHFTGSQVTTNKFETAAGTIECNTVSFTGTISGTSNTEVTTHPSYSNCTHSLVSDATVTTTGCNYILTGVTDANGDAQVHVECETGKKIIINLNSTDGLVNCDLELGSQTPTKGVSYTNEGTGTTRDIKVTATAEGITYTKTGTGGFGCAFVGGNGSDGVYTGSVTVKGYSDASHTTHSGIWFE